MSVSRGELDGCADVLETLDAVESARVVEATGGDFELSVITTGHAIPPEVFGVLSTWGVHVPVDRSGTRGNPTTIEFVGV